MSRAFDLTAPPPPRPRRARADADVDAAAVTLELDARWAAMFAATARRRAARRAGADDGRARAVGGRARTREWVEREGAAGRGRTDARGRTEAYGAAGVVEVARAEAAMNAAFDAWLDANEARWFPCET
ncbi:unnamed product [Ostreococcus tauri]|uniref:Unnamed product n=1 Tax=Ostreococcus tauri TaxID=70448 RepID=A0A090M048_OSTTA|nr:unnamed product [Ostreococcus tauri]CEF97551.1 unnamed product [Ostreococcus tauri]|eukprot:XP_022838750.1 unnamed product [Ostreococcus tauri]